MLCVMEAEMITELQMTHSKIRSETGCKIRRKEGI